MRRRRSALVTALAAAVLLATVAAAGPVAEAAGEHRSGAAAVERHYPVMREAAQGAPQYTVYRPVGARGRLPLVVWGNGACNHTSDVEFIASLSLLASHGFVVVAEGYYAGAPSTGVPTGVQPSLLTGAIDWAQQAAKDRHSGLRNKIDPRKIAVAGQSCGGLEALVAGADPRVDAVLSLNSGFFPTPIFGYDRSELAKLHTPVLFLEGGPTDVAYQNTLDNYALVTVPAIHVSNTDAGHTGLWHNTRNDVADATITLEADTVLTNYLDFTINGNRRAGAYFLGTDPELGEVAKWSAENRNY